VVVAREFEVQAARNNALLEVALAYFDVQQARGQLAATLDMQAKAEELVTRVTSLAKALTPEIEIDRARALLADVKQQVATAQYAWRASSARLVRILRLHPSSVVLPNEPPHLQIMLIPPGTVVDELVAVGLTSRPELAAHRALVEATLERLRQEKLRPLIPSLVLQGRNSPGNLFNGDIFGAGRNDQMDTWGGRFDMDVAAIWTLNNLGMGNITAVRERKAEEHAAVLQLFDLQDQVAQEVVQAHAQLEQRAAQVAEAEMAVKEALVTFNGNLIGITQVRTAGDFQLLVNRPQEAVAALQQLGRAYDGYYVTINGYNRAQFQLYHALGYPSQILACQGQAGPMATAPSPPASR
jgi:outer membrane protein TolC